MIDRCYNISKKRSIAHGGLIGLDVVSADGVFLGFPYEEDTDPRFNAVTFSVEGIDDWIGISGIEVEPRLEETCSNYIVSATAGDFS